MLWPHQPGLSFALVAAFLVPCWLALDNHGDSSMNAPGLLVFPVYALLLPSSAAACVPQPAVPEKERCAG
ncbi:MULTISPECIES: hypothetical protein [Pseudomonas aeruginosa group]|uniref:Membrane protein n=1 Tax=Pseudomonas paraeruginosa TaxID=2994495 RepID=A0A2R3J3D6_9PSED|nr:MULTISPECIES: hypothetical protein [Pseudomonas aeruginosa group]AVK08626.1 putative membrane protein [Pseudomonas paraeruginosa]MCF1244124.1 hypothetical protein [Pseudomonas aeruginosa]MCR3763728.1 hypothetical protein [Pseudomonas aeruginosa]MCT9633381.1 hypothetical protein [Pseudomonas aeruginosa]MCV2495509.1 hypothetical protein [Pseudomonas aeruginosa]